MELPTDNERSVSLRDLLLPVYATERRIKVRG